MIRSNWTQNEILKNLNLPLLDLIFKAQKVHKKYFPKKDVQLASLLSIKTGACPENCKYCPQSAHYKKHRNRQHPRQRGRALPNFLRYFRQRPRLLEPSQRPHSHRLRSRG